MGQGVILRWQIFAGRADFRQNGLKMTNNSHLCNFEETYSHRNSKSIVTKYATEQVRALSYQHNLALIQKAIKQRGVQKENWVGEFVLP